ncbi:hypothetical protein RIF29_19575 [Crotalaria pallida]|uniref:Uncharacterized protein n=1 Tax=Crotalaria pallida TaxID=3830 RepID=A0AAN9F1I3_CROPI
MVMASKRIKKKAEKKGSKMLLKVKKAVEKASEKGDIFKAIFRVNAHNRLEICVFLTSSISQSFLVVVFPFLVFVSWGGIMNQNDNEQKNSKERADIKDKDDAKPLRFNAGSIQFENVHFRWVAVSLVHNFL